VLVSELQISHSVGVVWVSGSNPDEYGRDRVWISVEIHVILTDAYFGFS